MVNLGRSALRKIDRAMTPWYRLGAQIFDYSSLMVAIRLSRIGKKNHATFRLVVSDKQKDTHGTYLELLGNYDPHQQPAKLDLKEDRVKYWLSVGAQPSDTVYNLLVEKGVLDGPKKVLVKAKKEVAPETPAPAPVEPAAPKAEEKPGETPAA